MLRNKSQKKFLQIGLIFNLILLIPLFKRKPHIKDWVIVYFFNAATNSLIDNVLSKYKIVKYPIRLAPRLFHSHILFDFFLYPTFTVFFNQITYKNRPLTIVYKLLLLVFPPFLIELWAERKTNLIEWSKKWKWYHTLLSIIIKSLITRLMISWVRKIDEQSSFVNK